MTNQRYVTQTETNSGGTADAYTKTTHQQAELRHIMTELDGCTEADARILLASAAK